MSPPSTLICSHDNEISVALMGDAHNSVRRVPGSDFHFPGPMEGIRHEVAELGQGFLIVVIEYHRRLGWCGDAQVSSQDWGKTRLGIWESCNEVDVCARVHWQHVEEGDFGT